MARPIGSKNSFSNLHCRKGHDRSWLHLRPNGDIRCMRCERWSRRKVLYGITEEQFDVMFESQGRCCAVCRTDKPDGDSGDRDWCVEHSHQTNKVRGITCHACNRALGNVKDNIEILQALIEYLKRTEYAEHGEDSGYNGILQEVVV